MMKKAIVLGVVFVCSLNLHAQHNNKAVKSGNPVFAGWYADPEGIIFNDTYWIYPT